jgi:hypothetical protein
MTNDILETLQILSDRCESITAVTGPEIADNRFSRAIRALESLAIERHIPIAIVGGLGAIRYGYAAATDDIDISIGDADLDSLLEAAPNYGFKVAWRAKSGWHTITWGNVEINIVPEGRRARDEAPTLIPSPRELGVEQGLGYASLAGWIELKISSGRQKDFGHIVEVLKRIGDEQVDVIDQHLSKIHPSYQQTFSHLIQQSKAEKQQERRRE